MNKLLFSLLLLITIGFYSCETDIDVNAEYKDIPVIYGLINPLDTVHYLKISKAFLGETSALDLAADANNFNYAAGELDVTVEEYNNGSLIKSFSTGASTLIRTVNEIPKDPGIFDNSTNVLYKFVEPLVNRKSTYKLKIINTSLNKEITAETRIVDTTIVTLPANIDSRYQFWIGTVATGNFGSPFKIEVNAGANVGRVKPYLVFNYLEHYTLASMKDSVYKQVIMPFAEQKTTTSLGGEKLKWTLDCATFFDNIRVAVSSPSSVPFFSHRSIKDYSLEFDVAGTELSTYMSASAPSNTVNQDKPDYTNLENGIGVFSSREKHLRQSINDPWSTNKINLHDYVIKYLESLNLGFCFGKTGIGNPVAPCIQQ